MADDDQQDQDQQDGAQDGQQEDGGKPEPDWKAEARKWESRAKKNDVTAKANAAAAKRLADIEAVNQTEAERLQAAAKAAEDRAAAAERRAAAATIRSTLVDAGYPSEHAGALIDDMNVSRYIGDDGQVDTEAVAAKYGPLAPSSGPRAPARNPAQGNGAPQRTLRELIADAEKSGNTRQSMRLKTQLLRQQRTQQG
jgi:hypothetical protein